MAFRIDFQGQLVFKLRRLATAVGVKADFSVVAGQIPSRNIEDRPSLLISPDTRAHVLPHSRDIKLLEGKDE